MGKKKKKRMSSQAAGLAPGTLIHVGEAREAKVKVTLIDYDENEYAEKEISDVKECAAFRDKPTVTWINVDGVHELDLVEALGSCYGLHPLLLEDIVNTTQRPKSEDFEGYIFMVMKMLYPSPDGNGIEAEQVSMVMGKNFVITFQERPGDVFDGVRERLRNGKGRVRKSGADYLAYALMDAIVDSYFAILEGIGENIEGIEEDLVGNPEKKTLTQIHGLKRTMIFLRRSIWPLREVIMRLERGESELFAESTLIYLRDVYDHAIQVIDTIEANRDVVSGMIDLYLSSVSNRMNEVMKVLTIIATIFIPLSFFAGLYGMNFDREASAWNMPELGWRYGYPVFLGCMATVVAGMLVYFRRKKWL